RRRDSPTHGNQAQQQRKDGGRAHKQAPWGGFKRTHPLHFSQPLLQQARCICGGIQTSVTKISAVPSLQRGGIDVSVHPALSLQIDQLRQSPLGESFAMLAHDGSDEEPANGITGPTLRPWCEEC